MDLRYFLFACSLQLAVSQRVTRQCNAPRAVTETGNVSGTRIYFENIPVNAYYGIPYATPPVGDLRFKPTVPVKKWNGTLYATQKPPACFQIHSQLEARAVDQTSPESENCLYLNIWAPATARPTKRAVMVWIHGGNFTFGSSALPVYDGLVLSALGDVIVVTLNYRMGMIGFLTSETADAPGNAALYDQLEALRWTKKNIAAFGGDPSRITFAGDTVGSISVSIHALSSLSKDLFLRAIMESGSAAYLAVENPHQNLDISDKVSRAMGCANDSVNIKNQPATVVACLRRSDPRTLTDNSLYQLLPQFGDPFMPKNARQAIINGEFKNCDLLIGNSADEGSILLDDAFIDIFGINGQKNQHPTLSKAEGFAMLTGVLMAFGLNASASESVANYYLGKVVGDNNEEVVKQVYTAIGDFVLLCPPVYTAETSAKQGNRVYYYQFAHRPSNTVKAEWMGVTHFEEVQFVFGVPLREPNGYTAEEVQLSRRMVRWWSNFVKTGSPDSGMDQPWPLYSRQGRTYRVLNITAGYPVGYGPHAENCDFFRPMFGF